MGYSGRRATVLLPKMGVLQVAMKLFASTVCTFGAACAAVQEDDDALLQVREKVGEDEGALPLVVAGVVTGAAATAGAGMVGGMAYANHKNTCDGGCTGTDWCEKSVDKCRPQL